MSSTAPKVERVESEDFAPGSAGELVAQGATLMRIENETMMSVAVQRPRNEKSVIENAVKELEMMVEIDPGELLKTYYSIRYHDGTMVEGPSIKAAQNLARRWGNCTTGARILAEDNDGYNLEGFFVDYETNYRLSRPQRVSKWFRRRNGRVELLRPDRQLVVVQAGASKAMRNAILSSLPSLIVSHYYRTSKKLAGSVEKVDQIKSAFAKWEVTVEMLETYLEASLSEWSNEHLADLRGLYNTIKDGQTTVDQVFGKQNGEEEVKAEPESATDLMPKAKPMEEPKPEEPKTEAKKGGKEAGGGNGGNLFGKK